MARGIGVASLVCAVVALACSHVYAHTPNTDGSGTLVVIVGSLIGGVVFAALAVLLALVAASHWASSTAEPRS